MNDPTPVAQIGQIDLPGLQRRLDALPVGQQLTIAISDFRRMFGMDDAGVGRLANFAKGHGCSTEATPSTIIFHKQRITRG